MKHIIKIFTIIILFLVVAFTSIFVYLQIRRSQTIDENLVSSLTTKLEITLIQQVITKITAPVVLDSSPN